MPWHFPLNDEPEPGSNDNYPSITTYLMGAKPACRRSAPLEENCQALARKPCQFGSVAYGYEIEGNARLFSNHPRVTPWRNFECTSRFYLRLITGWIFDHHTARDDIANMILRIFTHLRSGMQRPPPAWMVSSKSNGGRPWSCIRASTAVNKYSDVTGCTRISFNNA
jgi:hypothetical protein